MRNPISSNRMRVISEAVHEKQLTDLAKYGFKETDLSQIEKFFDPLRLKILVMQMSEANPIGKNADYFFL